MWNLFKKHKILILFVGLVAFSYYFVFSPIAALTSHARTLPEKIKPIIGSFAAEDPEFLVLELEYIRDDLVEIDESANRLRIFSVIPYFGPYFSDLKVISTVLLETLDTSVELFTSIETLFPDLNFAGWGTLDDTAVAASGSSLTEVSAALASELPKYKRRFEILNRQLSTIDPNRYPVSMSGIPLRQSLQDVLGLSSALADSFDEAVELIGLAPELVGELSQKNYLVLLVNDKELRPSGGIPIAYTVISVNRGVVSVSSQGNVLSLDSKHAGSGYAVRDAGFSADFKESAEALSDYWFQVSQDTEIHGVIAIDTHFIETLTDKIKKVSPSHYQNFGSKDVVRELQRFSFAEGGTYDINAEHSNDVSSLLFKLMESAFNTSLYERSELAKVVLGELKQKHMLLYFSNPDVQRIVEKHGLAGRVQEYDGDYLYILDSNVGQDRSNLFIESSVTKTVERSGDGIIGTVEITYNNLGDFDEFLNRGYKNSVSIYVPKGAVLIEGVGFTQPVVSSEEFGKTKFSGYLEVAPKSEHTIAFKYSLPGNVFSNSSYDLLIQKQPGSPMATYIINAFGESKTIEVSTDTITVIN